jgi:hypothetical protein
VCKEEVDRLYLMLTAVCPVLLEDLPLTTTATTTTIAAVKPDVCPATGKGDDKGCTEILKIFKCEEKYIDGTVTGSHCPITCDMCPYRESDTPTCNGKETECTNIVKGDGDCDKDSDCADGLKCGEDTCKLYRDSSSWSSTNDENTWDLEDDCCYDPNEGTRARRAEEEEVASVFTCTPQALAIAPKYVKHCNVITSALTNLAVGFDPTIRGGQGPDIACLGGGTFMSFANLSICEQTVSALNNVLHDDRHDIAANYPIEYDLCHSPTTVTSTATSTITSTATSTVTTFLGNEFTCNSDGHFIAGKLQTYTDCLGYARKLNRMIQVCNEEDTQVGSTGTLSCDGEGRLLAYTGDPFALNTILKDLISYEPEDYSPLVFDEKNLLTAAVGCKPVARYLGRAMIKFESNDYRVCDWTTATSTGTTTASSTITTSETTTATSTQTTTAISTVTSSATSTASSTLAVTDTSTQTSTASTTPITAQPLFRCETFDKGDVNGEGTPYDPLLAVTGFFECQQLANLFNQMAQLCTAVPELTCDSIGGGVYVISTADEASCQEMVMALTAVDASLNKTPLNQTVPQLTCASNFLATDNCDRTIEAYTANQNFLAPEALQKIIQAGYTCECPTVETAMMFYAGQALESLDESMGPKFHNKAVNARLRAEMLIELADSLKAVLVTEPGTSHFIANSFDFDNGKAEVTVFEELAIGSGGRCGTLETEMQVAVSGTFELNYNGFTVWSGSPPASATAAPKSGTSTYILGALLIVGIGVLAWVFVKREAAKLALPITGISGAAVQRRFSADGQPIDDDDKPVAFFQPVPSPPVSPTPKTNLNVATVEETSLFAVTRRSSIGTRPQEVAFDGFGGGATTDDGAAAVEEASDPIVMGINSSNLPDLDIDEAESEEEPEPEEGKPGYVAQTMGLNNIKKQNSVRRPGANPEGKRWQSNMADRMSKFSSTGSMNF